MLFLEGVAPLNGVGAQALHFLQPFATAALDPVRYATLARYLEQGRHRIAPGARLRDSATIQDALAELVAYAKANPNKLNFGSAGHGNFTHLAAELFKLNAGIEMVHVPYKSGAEMVTSILSEQTQVAFPDISILLPLIREKKLKAGIGSIWRFYDRRKITFKKNSARRRARSP